MAEGSTAAADPNSTADPSSAGGVRRARTHTELMQAVSASPDDVAFLRYEIPAELAGPAWILGRSVVCYRRSHRRRDSLLGLGDPSQIGALLDGLSGRPEVAGLASFTMPRSGFDVIAGHLRRPRDGGDWDWLYTEAPPAPIAAERRLSELSDAADAAELNALNARGNVTAESAPGTGRTELWIGARDDAGSIIAAGALHRTPAGAAHLTGIVVDPDHRGEGLGAAVTAALTRAAITGPGPISGVCSLGMYADNLVAARLYGRLGYRRAQLFASRLVDGF